MKKNSLLLEKSWTKGQLGRNHSKNKEKIFPASQRGGVHHGRRGFTFWPKFQHRNVPMDYLDPP
jgi:hypothetical protein